MTKIYPFNSIAFFLPILFLFFVSCKESSIQHAPIISEVSIQPDTICALQDSVIILLKYEDKNGDLGENKAGAKNVFVTDKKNNLHYDFRLQQLTPDGATMHIRGELKIVLNATTVVTEDFEALPLSYSIQVEDRAGNRSNIIETPLITLVKQHPKCLIIH